MRTEHAFYLVELALQQAHDHVSGKRDVTLPDHFDSHIKQFVETLETMKNSLQKSDLPPLKEYMGRLIIDMWPLDSPLGDAICAAENAYHSIRTRNQ